MFKGKLSIILFSVIFSCHIQKGQAQKTDTIVHINGNILTGELKNLNYGVVTWKMDGMGTISLEEPKIETIISKKQFEIKMFTGKFYYASFEKSEKPRSVYLKTQNQSVLVKIDDIVEIYPIKRSFWDRTSGNFSLGLNYTKGSNVATLAFSGNMDYRKKISYFSLRWDTNDTYQGDSLSATKTDISFAWQRSLKNGWYGDIGLAFSQNSELGTKSRIGLNLTGIKDLVYNEWNRLYAGAGLNLAQEKGYDNALVNNDLAGIFELQWKVYKLTSPKIWVDSGITFLPYFTDAGRNRLIFNLNPKVSLLSNNFKVGLNFYYNYDSKPTSIEGANNDYGLNLQFTYALH